MVLFLYSRCKDLSNFFWYAIGRSRIAFTGLTPRIDQLRLKRQWEVAV